MKLHLPTAHFTALACLLAHAVQLCAAEPKTANPSNYRSALKTLVAGDTLTLEAGIYPTGMPISDRNGNEKEWITIQGPTAGVAEIHQTSGSNCVELWQCSYLALKNLTIKGEGIDGIFGISAKGGHANLVHHILIEGCIISDWNTSQQDVGISTKTPTWDWTIRGNKILNCGTGIYLGNSNGADPFVRSVIENNLVQNPIGYCMEIKFQKPRPAIPGMPVEPSSTLIRHNVFIKSDAPSPNGNRPNLLVGGFPDSGPGVVDLYEIYGNLLCHNPRESLLQASGRAAIHDNVFVDSTASGHAAITMRNHDSPLKLAHVYNNTIYAATRGINIPNAATEGHAVIGNLVFATTPMTLHGSLIKVSANLTDSPASAAKYLMNPSIKLGAMNLFPKNGQCQDAALDLSAFVGQTDSALDFNRKPKGGSRFRGAYAGQGTNPGWQLQSDLKRQ